MDVKPTSPLPILTSLDTKEMDAATASALRLYPDEVLQAADRQTLKKENLDNPFIYFLGCCRGIYKDYLANGGSLPSRYETRKEFLQKGTSQSLPYQKPGYYEKLRQESSQAKAQTDYERQKANARINEICYDRLQDSKQKSWTKTVGSPVQFVNGHPVLTDEQRAVLLNNSFVQRYFKDHDCTWEDVKAKFKHNDAAVFSGEPLQPVPEVMDIFCSPVDNSWQNVSAMPNNIVDRAPKNDLNSWPTISNEESQGSI